MGMPDLTFGPVPSRRLGKSLGINNIPPKICTYACVYCQLGRTLEMSVRRRSFYEPLEILRAVQVKVERAKAAGEAIDYLTVVPDGEPTLDSRLGETIDLLKPLGIPVAVITNSSLIGDEAVRADLRKADWVSLKFDAVSEDVWHKIDRPARLLSLPDVLDGALAFASSFGGKLVTETMLVQGVNDSAPTLAATAGFIAQLQPSTAYLAIPTRPPAEEWVLPPDEATINRAYHVFSERIAHVEVLIGYEGNAFAQTGDPAETCLPSPRCTPCVRMLWRSFWLGPAPAKPLVEALVAQGGYPDALRRARLLPAQTAPARAYDVSVQWSWANPLSTGISGAAPA